MKTCPRCAASLADNVSFCPTCGSAVGAYAGAPSLSPPANPLNPGVPMAYVGQPETSGKAIASLVCGVIAYVLLPFIAAIPAVILGHIALSDIKKSAGRLKGQGLAIAGLVLGYFGVALLPFILIIAAIAIPNLLRARMAANEASAVGTLRIYNRVMVNYAAQCPNAGFPPSVTNLGPGNGDCDGANLIDAMLASPAAVKSGYRFFYSPGSADNAGHIVTYTITADPVSAGATGVRHFFTDESGVMRLSSGTPATADSAPIE
jgi:type IV pilus assembly protein PilA